MADDMTWGNPLTVDDENYPHNSEQDRRFEIFENRKIEDSSGQIEIMKINRLSKYWSLVGLPIILSPDSGEIGNGVLSDSYKQKLIESDPKLYGHFF